MGTSATSTNNSPWGDANSPWGQRRRRPSAQPGQQPPDPNAPPPGQPPSTFAQMQASGMARPAPGQQGSQMLAAAQPPATNTNLPQSTSRQLSAPTNYGGILGSSGPPPQANAVSGGPGGATDTGGGGGTSGTGTRPLRPGDAATNGQGVVPYRPDPYQVQQSTPAIGGDLSSAVQNALHTGSRYNLPEVQRVRDALQGQLQTQFGAQKKQLDEEMARRGIGASSIASGYYGDLAGQQANAMAGLDASLIQDQAGTAAADTSASLGAGQNLYNSQAQQGLGYSQLGLQNALGGGALGLGAAQLNQQGSQFGQSLAEQIRASIMGDTTANRGLDIQGKLANNDLMMRVMALINGWNPDNTSTNKTNTTNNTGSTGSTGSTGTTGSTGGTDGTITANTTLLPGSGGLPNAVTSALAGNTGTNGATTPLGTSGGATSGATSTAGGLPAAVQAGLGGSQAQPQQHYESQLPKTGGVMLPDGTMADPAHLPTGFTLTPEAQARLAAGWQVNLQPGGGAQYQQTQAVNPSTLNSVGGVGTADGGVATWGGQPGGTPITLEQWLKLPPEVQASVPRPRA